MAKKNGKAKSNQKKVRETPAHRLLVLPPPAWDLMPEVALDWLRRDFQTLSDACRTAMFYGDEPHRAAASMVLRDVETIVEAVAEALATGEPQGFRIDNDLCFHDLTADLARTVAGVLRCHETHPPDGLDVLAEVLAARTALADVSEAERGEALARLTLPPVYDDEAAERRE